MAKITVIIHKSIRQKEEPYEFIGEFHGISILEAMEKMMVDHPDVRDLCLLNSNRKPGILYISQSAELASLGLLESIIEDEDIEIRIVPVLHGG